jgi:hypothetical protein
MALSRLGSIVGCLAACAMVGCGSSSGNDGAGTGGPHDAGNGDVTSGTGPSRDAAGAPGDASTPTDAGTPGDAGAPTDGGAASGPLVQTFVGINGFNWNSAADLSVAGSVREYTDWSWTEGTYPYPHNQDDWYDWSHDAFYASLTDAGIDPMPCVEQGVSFVNDGGIPPANGDPTLPASYAAHADHMFQYAARYGSTKVATDLLKDDAGYTWAFPEPALTGINEIHYFENGNEDDATWILPGGAPLMSATEMAAMCSADYDGDQGRLGTAFGVKQADPNAKMVLSGMSQASNVKDAEAYLEGILQWSQQKRGGSVPFDVINLHYYDFGPKSTGVSPEDMGLLATMQQYAQWRDANMPGKEVWVTEFGYDTDPASPLGVPATIGPNSAFIVQGQWLVRSMLAMMQAGIDRSYIYWIADQPCESDAGNYCAVQFNTCGLIDANNAKKASYFMVNAFRSRLATMRYAATVTSNSANVDIVSFRDTKSAGGAYVLWAPTSNATVVKGYALDLGASATSATQVLLADQQMTGVASTLMVSGGKVTVDVTETPTLVLVDQLP